jgi:hypothetical protein
VVNGFKPARENIDVGAGFKPARKNNLNSEGLKPSPTKTHGVFEIVRALKTFSSRQMNKLLEIENGKKLINQKDGNAVFMIELLETKLN